MTEPIAVWDWEREPVPDARVVVVRPEPSVELGDGAEQREGERLGAFIKRGGRAIMALRVNNGTSGIRRLVDVAGGRVVPALYAERQADLWGLPDLLAVKATRRALVLCPREPLDIIGAWGNAWRQEGVTAHPIDLVVIIPPPEARTCAECGGRRRYQCHDGDDGAEWATCEACAGRGVIGQTWPVSAAWVRGIVKQCQAAGVPVICLTEHLGAMEISEWLS